jgi:hypothetical protein
MNDLTTSMAASSVANSTAGLQDSVGISMLKKARDNTATTMTQILSSVSGAAGAPAQPPSPPGVGGQVDVNA